MSDDHTSGEARDAHLLAALRHAPDRDAAPSPQLSARILQAARAAVQPARMSWRERWALWWRQPSVGAAFGTLAVAALVGVLWSTREPPVSKPAEALREERVAPPAAPAPALPPVTASPTEPVRRAEEASAAAPAPVASAPAPARPPARKAAPPSANAPARARAASAPSAPRPPPPAAATVAQDAITDAAPAAVPSRADVEKAERVREVMAAPVPPAVAPAPPAPAAAAKATANEAATTFGQAGRMRDRGAASMLAAPAHRADSMDWVETLMGNPANASRTTWQSGAGAGPYGAVQQAWWQDVRAATQGRWEPRPAGVPTSAPWLALSIDGRARAQWWLEADALILSDAEGRAWRAPIDAEQRERWRQAVAGW